MMLRDGNTLATHHKVNIDGQQVHETRIRLAQVIDFNFRLYKNENHAVQLHYIFSPLHETLPLPLDMTIRKLPLLALAMVLI